MTFDAQRPASQLVRLAEDCVVIPLRVANRSAATALFQFVQEPFQGHDSRRLVVPGLAQRTAQQAQRRRPLSIVHVLDLQALALVLGDEMPVETQRGIGRQHDARLLLVRQRFHEGPGGHRHAGARIGIAQHCPSDRRRKSRCNCQHVCQMTSHRVCLRKPGSRLDTPHAVNAAPSHRWSLSAQRCSALSAAQRTPRFSIADASRRGQGSFPGRSPPNRWISSLASNDATDSNLRRKSERRASVAGPMNLGYGTPQFARGALSSPKRESNLGET